MISKKNLRKSVRNEEKIIYCVNYEIPNKKKQHLFLVFFTGSVQPFVFIVYQFRIALSDGRIQTEVAKLGVLGHEF